MLTVDMGDGSKKRVWCTFGAQQIDIDPFSASGMPAGCVTARLSGASCTPGAEHCYDDQHFP